MEKPYVSKIEAKQANSLAHADCTHILNMTLLLEKLKVISDHQMIKSGDLYTFNFYREIHHLRSIRPDLIKELNLILSRFYNETA